MLSLCYFIFFVVIRVLRFGQEDKSLSYWCRRYGVLKTFSSYHLSWIRSFFYPFHSRTHVAICEVESRMEGKCKPLFSHCWSEKQFLLGNDSYVYEHSEFFVKDSFSEKEFVGFR